MSCSTECHDTGIILILDTHKEYSIKKCPICNKFKSNSDAAIFAKRIVNLSLAFAGLIANAHIEESPCLNVSTPRKHIN